MIVVAVFLLVFAGWAGKNQKQKKNTKKQTTNNKHKQIKRANTRRTRIIIKLKAK
ncbi:hypothetical protein M5D96_002160 [Drosophila gunungcola]|uniref:Uncharacterized protein n=1 Tax=Drosophila gunungcola TaxID=103775 RepID=A0A9P9YZI4_9MUSC|nr:hypothetical protein M5D96_002160 [Drosophila gunungcola]